MSFERKSPPQSTSPKVPAYIVTFSDMVTLLLTFFVMLLSLSHMKEDPESIELTRSAFLTRFNTFGLGTLFGNKISPELDKDKSVYFIGNPDEKGVSRTISSSEEDVRRIYKKVAESMITLPSQIVAKTADFSVTNVSFPAGGTELDEPSRIYLRQFATNLEYQSNENVKLYVLGLANEGQSAEHQWILSAKRAQSAANFLKGILTCSVYSWGAGPGGDWVSHDSPVYDKSQILIAVLRGEE